MKLLKHERQLLDPQQELLLQVALTEGDGALVAWDEWKTAAPDWNQWKTGIEFERLDPDSYRLLPLLYHNLAVHGVQDPLMEKIKGVYRHTWSSNKLLIHKTAPVLRAFAEAGIPTMVLKGGALIGEYYLDSGLRPMADLDLLVHPSDRQAALSLLKELGWTVPDRGCVAKVASEVHCTDRSGRNLDLHWHLFPYCTEWTDVYADDPFWAGAVWTRLGDCPVYVLNPTDQFFHVCVHGSGWGVTLPIRWVADACMILRRVSGELDWNRLLAEGKKWQVASRLHPTLNLLRERFGAAIPQWVLEELLKTPMTRAEQIEGLLSGWRSPGGLETLAFLYCQYKRYGPRIGISGFPRYLQYFWGVNSLWHVPAAAAVAALRVRRRLAAAPTSSMPAVRPNAAASIPEHNS